MKISYNPHEYTGEELPLYRKVDGGKAQILLIGVDAINFGSESPLPSAQRSAEKCEILGRKIESCEILLVEGKRWHVDYMDAREIAVRHICGKHTKEVEPYAIKAFWKKEGVIFPEESINEVELVKDYGITKDEYIMYDTCRRVGRIKNGMSLLNEKRDKKDLWVKFISGHFWARIGLGVEYADRSIDDEVKWFTNFASNMGIDKCERLGSIFDWYLARIRDDQTLGPRIKEIGETREGNIGVVVRADHVAYLEKIIKGKDIETIDPWDKFIAQIDVKYAAIKKIIEQITTDPQRN